MGRKSPQEKKRLSYLKDGRDTYGENAKASRKNLPRAKAFARRANRARDSRLLRSATGVPDDVCAEAVELRLLGRRREVKRKWADTPLGEYVEWRLTGREPGAPRVEAARERVRRRLRLPGSAPERSGE